MRRYVHYCSVESLRGRSLADADTEIAIAVCADGQAGIAFILKDGRLRADFISLPSRGRKGGGYHHVPISQADADMLTPLSARQALWEEAMTHALTTGLIAATALRPQDAAALGGAPEEDHE